MLKVRKRIALPSSLLVFACLCFPISNLAQSLPEQMQFNQDMTRLSMGGVESTGFYDDSSLKSVYLDFYDENFWQLMKDNYETANYVLASLSYEGVKFDSVAIQFKGQTSYRKPEELGSEKLSFSVKLDEVIDGQDIDGYNNFNFNNAFQDFSFMKEVVYARLSRDVTPSLKGNYIKLYLNGEDWGIYTNIQQLNGDFIKEWFMSKDGIRWRADVPPKTTKSAENIDETPGGGANWGDGTAALNDLGSDTTSYQQYYTLKDAEMDDPWSYLQRVCEKLNNTPTEAIRDTLKNYLDIDGTLWYLAQEILFSDDDSYVHKGKMDYYLYLEKETGRMIPLEFDGNSAMGLRNIRWSPFLNEEDVNYPLMNILFSVPELRQRYIAHVKTFLGTAFDSEKAMALIDQYASLVSPEIQTDPRIDFSYEDHLKQIGDLRRFVNRRPIIIGDNAEFQHESPNISELKQWVAGSEGAIPGANEEVTITARATHPDGLSAFKLYYGTGLKGNFTSLMMNDNGSGADETAADGNFSASIPGFTAGKYVRYYVEAVAGDSANTAAYFPERAEYDVFVYRVAAQLSQETDLVINELLASNGVQHMDEAGEFDDWVEIYNMKETPISLDGYHLSDDTVDLYKWTFPEVSIEGGEYLIVWTDDDIEQGALHTNFKLSADGEALTLTDKDGNIVDQVFFSSQTENISYGRWPNGTGDFSVMEPTFQAQNEIAISTTAVQDRVSEFHIYPNPARDMLRIVTTEESPGKLAVYSSIGQLVYEDVFTETLDISFLTPGLYIVRCGTNTERLLVQ